LQFQANASEELLVPAAVAPLKVDTKPTMST